MFLILWDKLGAEEFPLRFPGSLVSQFSVIVTLFVKGPSETSFINHTGRKSIKSNQIQIYL